MATGRRKQATGERRDLRPLDSLKPDPENARERTPRNLEAIKTSLREFGQQKPVVLDADGIIRAGNGTYLAAKELGWRELWVTQSELRGKRAVAYAIADNRTTDLSQFDETALIAAIGSLEPDLAAATGFDIDELAELVPTLEQLTGVDDADSKASGPRGMIDRSRVAVRVLVSMSNVEAFERAMAATGIENREKALLAICEAYLIGQG